MADIRVSDIRGVDLAVKDLPASVTFYSKLWGLEEVSRTADTVYLRATGREHHALALHGGSEDRVHRREFRSPRQGGCRCLARQGARLWCGRNRQPSRAAGGCRWRLRLLLPYA